MEERRNKLHALRIFHTLTNDRKCANLERPVFVASLEGNRMRGRLHGRRGNDLWGREFSFSSFSLDFKSWVKGWCHGNAAVLPALPFFCSATNSVGSKECESRAFVNLLLFATKTNKPLFCLEILGFDPSYTQTFGSVKHSKFKQMKWLSARTVSVPRSRLRWDRSLDAATYLLLPVGLYK